MPLTNIGRLPYRFLYSIIEERNKNGLFKDFIDFVIRMINLPDKITENQLSKLIDAGCFDIFNKNRKQLKLSIPNAIQYANNCVYQEGNLFNDFGLTFNYVDAIEDFKEKMKNEYEALGIIISDSPFNYLKIDKDIKLTPFDSLKANVNSNILGIIRNIKVITVKNGYHKGEPMAFLDIYNKNDDELSITLFSDNYAIYQSLLQVDKALIINGKLDINKANNKKTFICNKLKVLED